MPNQDDILDKFCKQIRCPAFHRVIGDCMMDKRCLQYARQYHEWLMKNGYKIVKETEK